MTVRQRDWSRAFAVQAKADMDAYNILAGLKAPSNLPECQRLHFLQMACEKLCKAHLCLSSDPDDVQGSHAVVRKHLPDIARTYISSIRQSHDAQKRAQLTKIVHLAREIDRLHPQIDDSGTRPDNCEYPWDEEVFLNSGDTLRSVLIPAQHRFVNLHRLSGPEGVLLLKILGDAIDRLIA